MEFACPSHPRWRITWRSECRTNALHSMPGAPAVCRSNVTGPTRVSAIVELSRFAESLWTRPCINGNMWRFEPHE